MFHTAREEEIKRGQITDVYFARAMEVLRRKGIRKHVVAEIRASSLPRGYDWALLAGIEEAAALLEGIPASVECMAEGQLFRAGEPVLTISGEYTAWGVYETPLLGLLCQASGVATRAARCKLAAAGRAVISFGARRMHPALAPMIERNAYLGGCEGVAVIKSGELIGEAATGTMPHALILVVGDSVEAFRLFDEVMPPEVRRICLVDTLNDEKFEAIAAAEALGERLYGVRLDTPGSRRGDMAAILREVRWELDLRGHEHVKLFVSGGLDEDNIPELNPWADAYGVGTAISNAPVINFALDIVEIEGKPFAKRGKWSGKKNVVLCGSCGRREIVSAHAPPDKCACGGEARPLLTPLTENGKLVRPLPPVKELREFVLNQLARLSGP
jgi:nicotinate phosphoribosyltransferase